MTLALVLFAIAALGGLTLAILRFREKPLPTALAVIHGLVAAVALVTLILAVWGGGAITLTRIALAFFVLAALGGFVLFASHLRGRPLSKGLIVVHGLAAVAGFVLLLLGTVGGP
ncbi:MAG: hypothetical protein ACRD1X_11825 [Vicinamibacteria bacterium]